MKIETNQYYQPQEQDQVEKQEINIISIDQEVAEPFKPHFGNNCFFFFKEGQPRITIGPHWPFTFVLSIGICLATVVLYQVGRKKYLQIGTIFCGFMLFASLIRACLKNPGVNFTLFERKKSSKSCPACKVEKQAGTVHCTVCDICVRGFDHHCPWIGKCIGEGNVYEFQLFLLSFILFFLYNLVSLMF